MENEREIEKITLDLTDCKYIMELHERIKNAFGFPDFYGRNLDALWDLLREPRSSYLTVNGVHTMSKDCRTFFQEIIKIFDEDIEWQAHWDEYFGYEIAD